MQAIRLTPVLRVVQNNLQDPYAKLWFPEVCSGVPLQITGLWIKAILSSLYFVLSYLLSGLNIQIGEGELVDCITPVLPLCFSRGSCWVDFVTEFGALAGFRQVLRSFFEVWGPCFSEGGHADALSSGRFFKLPFKNHPKRGSHGWDV